MLIYDAFYRWCRDAVDETHDWVSHKPRRPGSPSAPDGGAAADPRGDLRALPALRPARLGRAGGADRDDQARAGRGRAMDQPGAFNRLLAIYQVLPGPEAHELCVHLGMMKRGRLGGILAGLGFMLPGFMLILALAWLYQRLNLQQPRDRRGLPGRPDRRDRADRTGGPPHRRACAGRQMAMGSGRCERGRFMVRRQFLDRSSGGRAILRVGRGRPPRPWRRPSPPSVWRLPFGFQLAMAASLADGRPSQCGPDRR